MNNTDPIEQLTRLQATLSEEYHPGHLSTVAMLGLIGESGEVFAETRFLHDGHGTEQLGWLRSETLKYAKQMEVVKKRVRSGESEVKLCLQETEREAFIAELGDVTYYLNILATNVGLTLFDLAQMGYDKIKAKQQQGGSSEDRN